MGRKKGSKHTEETKKKMSKAHKGRVVTEEHKQKLSEANKGNKHTDETKKKMSEVKMGKYEGKDNPRAVRVYCPELDMYFDTEKEASEYIGCSKSNISAVLTGRTKTAYKLHWYYAEDDAKDVENKGVS